MKEPNSQSTLAADASSWRRLAIAGLRLLAIGLAYLLAIGAFLATILWIKTSYTR